MVYSRRDGPVRNLTDARDKRIGVGQLLGVGSYQLGALLLRRHGVELYRDAAQVVFYLGDYERQLNAVLHGEVDVGIVLGGWLEAHRPESISLLRIHAPLTPEYQSEPYPFLTSTELLPGFGIAAAAATPWRLQQDVMFALTSAPADVLPHDVAGFALAASYEGARKVGLAAGVIVQDLASEDTLCHDIVAPPYGFVACPDGYTREYPEVIERACARWKQPCPGGLECVCRACIPVRRVNVFRWEVVLGLCVTLFVAAITLTLGWRAVVSIVPRRDALRRARRRRRLSP